jgi:uncharacterized protein (TIGR03000 family)
MFPRKVVLAGPLTAVVAAILLAASPVAAQQQGWPLNQGAYNGYYWGGGAASAPRYVTPPISYPAYSVPYAAPAAAPTASPTEVRSFYPSVAGEEYSGMSTRVSGNRPVLINMSVRPDATISFGGVKTVQSGPVRAFVSPSLVPGRDYVYDLTVRWQEGGREVTQTRRLTVHAGDVINLSF